MEFDNKKNPTWSIAIWVIIKFPWFLQMIPRDWLLPVKFSMLIVNPKEDKTKKTWSKDKVHIIVEYKGYLSRILKNYEPKVLSHKRSIEHKIQLFPNSPLLNLGVY